MLHHAELQHCIVQFSTRHNISCQRSAYCKDSIIFLFFCFKAEELERPQFHGTHFENSKISINGKDKTSGLNYAIEPNRETLRDEGRKRGKNNEKLSKRGRGRGRGGVKDGNDDKDKDENEDVENREHRKAYPVWRRLIRYCFTIPPVVGALSVILVVMSTVFTTQVRTQCMCKPNLLVCVREDMHES